MFPQNQWQQNQIELLLSIFSILLGYENLLENRSQSAQNDVQAANDKQAQYLLDQLKTLFEEQNAMLKEIIERLERLEMENGT